MDDKPQENPPKVLPFHNLFLNSGFVHGNNHWSIYILTIGITAFAYFLAPVFTFIPLIVMAKNNGLSNEAIMANPEIVTDPVASGIDMNLILLALLGIFVFAFLGLWLGVKKIHNKTLTSIMTGYEKFRFKRFWFAFGLWSLLVVITVFVEYFSNPGEFKLVFNLPGFVGSFVLMVIFMPIQTGWEELFFRGYLVQGLSLVFKNGIIPLILTSLLFGLAHMTNPEVEKYGWQAMLPYYSSFGLFLGLITLVDEGLELAYGIHLANNIVSSIFVTSSDSVIKTYSVFEVGTTNPLVEIAVFFVLAALTFLIFKFKYRWKDLSLIIR